MRVKNTGKRKRELYNIPKRLLMWRARTITGALMLGNSETSADPVGILMQKAHSRIFIINSNDFANELILGLKYTEAQARAYVESVCQVPFHRPNEVSYSAADHPMPEVRSRVNVLNAIWFDNSWKGNSWQRNMALEDGGAPCFWTKSSQDAVDVMSSAHDKYTQRHPGRGWKIGLDRYKTYDDVFRQLRLFFETFPTEEKHVWIQGEVQAYGTTELLKQLQKDIFKAYSRHESTSAATDPQVVKFWNTPVGLSFGPSYIYGGRPAQRIPIVPWRPSNFGGRVYGGVTIPQLFPPTKLRSERKIPIEVREKSISKQEPVVYANYSGFVTLKAMTNPNEYDFGWRRISDNRYIMVSTEGSDTSGPEDGEYSESQLYTVSDPTFFNGLGSVCTSAHAVFSLGRREPDLVFQTRRRLETGHDTSGHMLAAPLMYLSHLLWYLQEVSDNFASEASIYNLPFKEPTRGLYHTTQEYKNALYDMRRSLADQYPFYARQNVDICERFVSSLSG
jgi:hypothetical protein